MLDQQNLTKIIEAIIFNANRPISEKEVLSFFEEEERPSLADFRNGIEVIREFYQDRGIEFIEVASGYHFQTKQDYAPWVRKLFDEKPPRYSRALLETLALIAYRQPITRGEIEEIRGVSISTSIFRTLDERNWIKIVGYKEVPGKPGLYATTKEFLDYFGLKSLTELPSLMDVLNSEKDKSKGENLEFALKIDKIQEKIEYSVEEEVKPSLTLADIAAKMTDIEVEVEEELEKNDN